MASFRRLFDALRAQGVTAAANDMDCSVTRRAGNLSTACCRLDFRDRVAAAVCANAGTYAMPDLDVAWPFGLGDTEVDARHAGDVPGLPDHRDGRH